MQMTALDGINYGSDFMIQRSFPPTDGEQALHVAIIMDGNGRWARKRGLPRTVGHQVGASAVRRTVSAAPSHGIGTLTLYAFSSDNWRRPPGEVKHLMRLFRSHLRSEADRLLAEGVRVNVIGRRDRLHPNLVSEIESLENRTREGRTLHLQIAVDYSARDAVLEAARRCEGGMDTTRDDFREMIARALHLEQAIPDVDLLVRTGGEQRLSDFLLWESAYAELVFTPCLWPDFDEGRLESVMREFHGRDRRFGGVREEGDSPEVELPDCCPPVAMRKPGGDRIFSGVSDTGG